MPKSRGPRHQDPMRLLPRHRAQTQNRLPRSRTQQARQVARARSNLVRRRLVLRRCAMGDGRDQHTFQREAVRGRDRTGLVGDSRAIEGGVQPLAAAVAREHPAGPIRAVCRGRQTNDEAICIRVAEVGYGSPPVGVVAKLRPLLLRHPLAPRDKPGTEAALEERPIQLRQVQAIPQSRTSR